MNSIKSNGSEIIKFILPNGKCLLRGIANIENAEKEIKILVIMVDDNSFSMKGARQDSTIAKSELIINYCLQQKISTYHYATFTDGRIQHGACATKDVRKFLTCSGGTKLKMLATSAIEGTKSLLKTIHFNDVFKLVYILNTDGRAPDGQIAVIEFNDYYMKIKQKYPNMRTPCSFVIGIGEEHDQIFLEKMGFGKICYFNYQDANISEMSSDAEKYIFPELSKQPILQCCLNNSKIKFDLQLAIDGSIDLSGQYVDVNDTSCIINGESFDFVDEIVNMTHPEYFNLSLKTLNDEILKFSKLLKIAVEKKKQNLLNEYSEKYQELHNSLLELQDSCQNSMICILESKEDTLNWQQKLKIHLKNIREYCTDKKEMSHSILELCKSGLLNLQNGDLLNTELEREFMELVSSCSHWSNKCKKKLMERTLSQVNSDSVVNVHKKVRELMASQKTQYYTNSEYICWLTTLSENELLQLGDILCLVGYIPPGKRNLTLCSASSAYVLNDAVLDEATHVCPNPVSFLTILSILLEGRTIAIGPDGFEINTVFCALPSLDSPLSIELAKTYAPLIRSLLLTTRPIYTIKSGEYVNGALVSLISMVKSTSESNFLKLMRAMDCTHATLPDKCLQDILSKNKKFMEKKITSGVIASPILAIAYRMINNAETRKLKYNKDELFSDIPLQLFFKELIMFIFRDKMRKLFDSYCITTDSDGDEKREICKNKAMIILETLVIGVCDLNYRKNEPVDNKYYKNEKIDIVNQTTPLLRMPALSFNIHNLEPELNKIDRYQNQQDNDDILKSIESSNEELHQSCIKEKFDINIQKINSGLAIVELRPCDIEYTLLSSQEKLIESQNGIARHGQSLCGDLTDVCRSSILTDVLCHSREEIRLLINAYNHLFFQECPDHYIKAISLNDILGIESDIELQKWLIATLAISIKFRTNKSYNNEIDSKKSLLFQDPIFAIEQMASDYRFKMREEYKKNEEHHIKEIKITYLRELYSMSMIKLPQKIFSPEHLNKINVWTLEFKNFEIIPSISPSTGLSTGMAKNTVLFPGTPEFMNKTSPSNMIVSAFGNGIEREQRGFINNFISICNEIYENGNNLEDFNNLFELTYENTSSEIITKSYMSIKINEMVHNKDDCEMIKNFLETEYIKKYEQIGDNIIEFIFDEYLWQTNPYAFLEKYFKNKKNISLEHFFENIGATTYIEKSIANNIFSVYYDNEKNIKKKTIVDIPVDLSLSKKERTINKKTRRKMTIDVHEEK